MKTTLFLLLASLCGASEIIIETNDPKSVQQMLDHGYTTKALAGSWSEFHGTFHWVFVLVEPSAEEIKRGEAERVAKIKADWDKRRAEYQKTLPPLEKKGDK